MSAHDLMIAEMEEQKALLQGQLEQAQSRIWEMAQKQAQETQGHPRAQSSTRYELAVALDRVLSQRESVKNELRIALNELEITKAKISGVDALACKELEKARVAEAELGALRSQVAALQSSLDTVRRASTEAFQQLAHLLGADANSYSMEELLARALTLKLQAEAAKEQPHAGASS